MLALVYINKVFDFCGRVLGVLGKPSHFIGYHRKPPALLPRSFMIAQMKNYANSNLALAALAHKIGRRMHFMLKKPNYVQVPLPLPFAVKVSRIFIY